MPHILIIPPEQHSGPHSHNKINIPQLLSLVWRTACEKKMQSSQRKYMTFVEHQQQRVVHEQGEGGVDGYDAAELQHRSNICYSCPQTQFLETELGYFHQKCI